MRLNSYKRILCLTLTFLVFSNNAFAGSQDTQLLLSEINQSFSLAEDHQTFVRGILAKSNRLNEAEEIVGRWRMTDKQLSMRQQDNVIFLSGKNINLRFEVINLDKRLFTVNGKRFYYDEVKSLQKLASEIKHLSNPKTVLNLTNLLLATAEAQDPGTTLLFIASFLVVASIVYLVTKPGNEKKLNAFKNAAIKTPPKPQRCGLNEDASKLEILFHTYSNYCAAPVKMPNSHCLEWKETYQKNLEILKTKNTQDKNCDLALQGDPLDGMYPVIAITEKATPPRSTSTR